MRINLSNLSISRVIEFLENCFANVRTIHSANAEIITADSDDCYELEPITMEMPEITIDFREVTLEFPEAELALAT